MNIGRAVAIFDNINNATESVEEKGEAIRTVLDMETHNSITKASMLRVLNWMRNQMFEEEKDLIQEFHDYQVIWLKDRFFELEFEPQLEELIIRFLHDTANCFLIEMDRDEYKE